MADLEAAGIDRVDGLGRTIDRHALRTTFRSWLTDCGVHPRLHGVLMRTAPGTVEDRHYQDYRLTDLWAEIAKLPSIAPVKTEGERCTKRCTESRPALSRPVPERPETSKSVQRPEVEDSQDGPRKVG